MKRALWVGLIIALTTSVYAEIVRRNTGVQKILPGNQITVSGNGTGVVTVGVSGAVATDTTTLQSRINQLATDTGTIKNVVALDTTTLLSMITFADNATSTNSILNDAQSNALSTTTDRLNERAVPTRWSDEGANLGNATAIDCVGSGVGCTISGTTVTLTVAGGSAVSNSTMSFTLGAGGDAYQATYTFIPIQGASRMVSQSTETTVSMQAFTLFPSTVASTFFKIAKSTATDAGISTAWTYISPHMEVSTGQVYGPIISTAVQFNANESYALHCTSFPVTGLTPAEYGVKIRYWNNPYP